MGGFCLASAGKCCSSNGEECLPATHPALVETPDLEQFSAKELHEATARAVPQHRCCDWLRRPASQTVQRKAFDLARSSRLFWLLGLCSLLLLSLYACFCERNWHMFSTNVLSNPFLSSETVLQDTSSKFILLSTWFVLHSGCITVTILPQPTFYMPTNACCAVYISWVPYSAYSTTLENRWKKMKPREKSINTM